MIESALKPGGALHPLTEYPQFMLWTTQDGRKVPISPHSLNVASVTDRNNHATADHCLAMAAATGYGLAFVFTADDPFFFADADHAYQDGRWSVLSQELCQLFGQAAVEVSQSGTGLHWIGKYSGTRPEHACKNVQQGLELYTADRFVALTGTGARGSAGSDCTSELNQFITRYMQGNASAAKPGQWDEAVARGIDPSATRIESDEELIQMALGSQSMFNTGKAKFRDLWEGDISKYNNDASSADRALAQHLAFWTGNDCERILRIMKQSGLVRDKWAREDYLHRTILSAVQSCSRFYFRPSAGETPASDQQVTVAYRYLGPDQQRELFAGCVYITESHRVLIPTGEQLRPEQFRVRFGGYNFPLDSQGRKTTKNAWEAFTESQMIDFPKVAGTTFRPDAPTGAIIEEYGRNMVNTYVPVTVPRRQGDPTPFLNHLAKLLPDLNDRTILLSYMAACVQHKGVKFQWAPLVQGAEGNGKSLLTRCLAFAVGDPYVHLPSAHDLTNKFNSWILGKCLIGIEDIYVPQDKLNVLEALKPMITNDRLEIQFKGADQVTKRVCANFILNSNYKDALRKSENDRRYCIFYCAQQSAADLKRDGMTGGYFPGIYSWLKEQGGYEIVSEYLHTYPIPPHLNPANACDRAPNNTSTREAIRVSADWREDLIRDAVESGLPGFNGGWIASTALARLFKFENTRMGSAAKADMLTRMGYKPHPALTNGRAHRVIAAEGSRPILYVHITNPDLMLTDPAVVTMAYEKAQVLQ